LDRKVPVGDHRPVRETRHGAPSPGLDGEGTAAALMRRVIAAVAGVFLLGAGLNVVVAEMSGLGADAKPCRPAKWCGTTSTTRANSTTTTSSAPPNVCVVGDWQAALTAAPQGASVCLTGEWSGTLIPKAGQRLVGPALLHGAIVKGGTDVDVLDVTVDGTGHRYGIAAGDRWTLTRVDVSGADIGIDLNTGVTVVGGSTHHNRQYGFTGGPDNDITIDGLDCSFNNLARLPYGNAGCSKIHGLNNPDPALRRGSERIRFLNMAVHHNVGHGLWCDWSCRDVTYANNDVYANEGIGIFHEVSFAATLDADGVHDNCTAFPNASPWNCDEILIANSRDVTVTGNVVSGWNGIVGKDPLRSDLDTAFGRASLCNVVLTGNTITAADLATGWVSGRSSECSGVVWTVDGVARAKTG
jgi:hypothetical protein